MNPYLVTSTGPLRRSAGRRLLFLAIACCLALVLPAQPAAAADSPPAANPTGNGRTATPDFADIDAMARELAEKPYHDGEAVPEFLASLSREQWQDIRLKPEFIPWPEAEAPLRAVPFHPGNVFTPRTDLTLAEPAGTRPLLFSPEMFTAADPDLLARIREQPAGFGGFSLHLPRPEEAGPGDTVGLVGASHFLFSGRNAGFGSYARPVAIDTALAKGEEIPRFRRFWLMQPEVEAEALTVFALMESPSLTGAFRLDIRPGTATVVDVQTRFYRRAGAALPEKIGLAPLASMFLYSELHNGRPGDYRPEVHNADGLLLRLTENDWQWMPLNNHERLVIHSFQAANPRGFGLLQRDDVFDHYQDLAARYDRRSSVWVEPVGEWGSGSLELIEIPGGKEFHNNIIAFWVPDASRFEAADEPNRPILSAAYTLYWMAPAVTPHDLGRVAATRMERPAGGDEVTFIIDFDGGELPALDADFGLTTVVEAPEEATLADKRLVKNPITGGWRLSLTYRLPQDGVLQRLLTARDGPRRLRFTAHLKKGENIPDPLTETWVFDFIP